MLVINCSKVIFFIVCYCFIPASRTLLFANRVLQHGYLLSYANMSLSQAIRLCLLIINCGKVIVYISLLIALRCRMLIISYSKVIFYQLLIVPCCKPYVVECLHHENMPI